MQFEVICSWQGMLQDLQRLGKLMVCAALQYSHISLNTFQLLRLLIRQVLKVTGWISRAEIIDNKFLQ